MNVTIDLCNDCPEHWAPAESAMKKWLNAAEEMLATGKKSCNISVRVVNEQDSRSLNRQYRGKDKATNVLSFPSALPATVTRVLRKQLLGDIALCAPVIQQEALQQEKSLEAHWAHLLTHGFLHLHGYDHETETEAQAMEQLEIKILSRLGYPSPY